jgi:hypothetical protein
LSLQQHQQQASHCPTQHYCCCCQLLPPPLALSWLALPLLALRSSWLPLRWQLLPLQRCGLRDLTWHLLLLLLNLLALTSKTPTMKKSRQKGWNVTMTCDSKNGKGRSNHPK